MVASIASPRVYDLVVATMRNAPTQERSRQTLESIIAAADALFAVKGVDGATNTEIAKEAGCSIGSLYRFFPNKEALVAEYVERYMQAMAANQPPIPGEPTIEHLAELVSDLVDRSVEAYTQFTGFKRVRQWRHEDGMLASQPAHDSERALVSSLFEASPYDLDADLIQRVTTVIVDGTWPLIAGLGELNKRDRAAMIDEIKFSLTSYIRARLEPFAG